jgi:amino acid adenylation domain-containing protein/FkbM family methyltransferase
VEFVPLVVDVAPEEPFASLLDRVTTSHQEIEAGKAPSFDELVAAFNRQGISSRNPLFAVAVCLSRAGADGPRLLPDALLRASVRQGQALVEIDYSARVVTAGSAERFASHVVTACADGLMNRGALTGRLRLISSVERERLASFGRGPDAALPAIHGVHQLVAAQARENPERSAVIDGSRHWTYAELQSAADCLAALLSAKGLTGGQRAGLCMAPGATQLAALFGIVSLGAAVVPLDPTLPEQRMRWVAKDAGLSLIVTDAQRRAAVAPADVPRCQIGDEELLGPSRDSHPELPHVSLQDPLYLMYTSGSTGTPKGVLVPHGTLLNLIIWQGSRAGDQAGLRTLQRTSLAFDVGFQEVFFTLAHGGCLVVVGDDDRADISRLPALLALHHIQRLYLSPVALAQWAKCMTTDQARLNELQEVIVAGDQLRVTMPIVRMFRDLRCTLDNQYGPTETHVVTAHLLNSPSTAWPELPPIGRPISNCFLYVVDEYDQLVPVGVVGEILVGGMPVALGYHNRRDETAKRFIQDPFRPGGRAYRTGDRGRWLEDGSLEFVGRNDRQVKVRGYRIELEEVEAVLSQAPGVHQAAVIAVPDRSGDRRLAAYVVPRDATCSPSSLHAFLVQRLPPHMVPAASVILVTAGLPMTTTGKIDRASLPAPQEFPADDIIQVGRDEIETRIAAIWQHVLQVSHVGVDDEFIHLGGHSFAGIQVAAEIKDAYGVTIPLGSLMQGATVARLAAHVREVLTPARADRIREPSQDEGQLVSIDLPDGARICTSDARETLYFYTDIYEQLSYAQCGIRYPPSGVVVDVGANVGLFSRFALARCPQGRIVAYEPATPLHDALCRNLAEFKDRAIIVRAALADSDRMASFSYYPRLSGMSTLCPRPDLDAALARQIVENLESSSPTARHKEPVSISQVDAGWIRDQFVSRTFEVRVTTLAEELRRLNLKRVDLLKIDVQRSELAVLRGLGDAWPFLSQLVIEVHDIDGALSQVERLLREQGFTTCTKQIPLHARTVIHFVYAHRQGPRP